MDQTLINQLKETNFLEINFKFNFKKLKKEILNAYTWYTHYQPPNYILMDTPPPEIHKEYKQFSLTTYDPRKSSKCIIEYFAWRDQNNNTFKYFNNKPIDRKWYYTEMAESFPYLIEICKKITDKPILCKVVKSSPGHGLGWHSHQNDPDFPQIMSVPETCILHIPIIQDEKVVFMVRDDMPEDRLYFDTLENYKLNKNVAVSSFLPGKIYFFNSFKAHAYKNYSNKERISVLIYNDIDDNPTLEKIISDSLGKIKND